jgi:hypothetical protein
MPLLPRPAALSAALLAALLAPRGAPALPLISEVFYDAVGADNGHSFVELFGTPGSALDGLQIEGVNGADGGVGPSLALSGVFPDDGLFVVADSAAGATSVPGADLVLNFDLQNGPDSVVLRDGAMVLDALGYGVFGPGEVFAGEGSPAPDPAAGSSLARRFADVDSDDNAADFVPLAEPTPGSAHRSLPEPGAGALLLAALACLGRPRRTACRRR